MPVGLTGLPKLHPVAGVRLGTTEAGIRKKNRRDLVLIACDPGTHAAAVFTRNRFCAAPVSVARVHLAAAQPRALLINTGNANAGTGARGEEDARRCAQGLARLIACSPQEVLPFSTGVIGERLPVDRLLAGLPRCVERLSQDGWAEAAHGIMTTDTIAKGGSRRLKHGAREITLTGICKGSGMIRPNMATMLAFIATDANLTQEVMDRALRNAVSRSFNRISVDGDTSTNDACVLLATGRSGAEPIESAAGEAYQIFEAALTELCIELAQAIVRDGEGATKFITVEVGGGATEADCLAVAYAVAESPLVKTAFFASDPNWGRILAAVGRAPVSSLSVERVSVFLDDVCVVKDGGLAADYREERGAAVMRKPEIRVRVALGGGDASAEVWTCDFSHDYVRINADYRS